MKPILLDIPTPILTPRLLIREPRPGDGKETHEAIEESFQVLHPWVPFAHKMPTLEETEESVRQSAARWILREDLRLMIFERSSGKFIGGTGLHRMNWDIPRFEIGYWIRKSHEGKGYVSEAANAVTRFAFKALGAKRVEARCDVQNERSIAVVKKLGFTLDGCMKNSASHREGEVYTPRDMYVFSRTSVEGLPSLQVDW